MMRPGPEQSVMVAGGNAGIGRSAAQSLAQLGATVHILCRSREKGEQAVKDIQVRWGWVAVCLIDLCFRMMIVP